MSVLEVTRRVLLAVLATLLRGRGVLLTLGAGIVIAVHPAGAGFHMHVGLAR